MEEYANARDLAAGKYDRIILKKVMVGVRFEIPKYVIEDMTIKEFTNMAAAKIIIAVSTHFLARHEEKNWLEKLKSWLGIIFDITPRDYYRVCPHLDFPVIPKELHIEWLTNKGPEK